MHNVHILEQIQGDFVILELHLFLKDKLVNKTLIQDESTFTRRLSRNGQRIDNVKASENSGILSQASKSRSK